MTTIHNFSNISGALEQSDHWCQENWCRYIREPMALNLGRESRTEILFSKVCHCHRSGSYTPQREDRPHQKRSKKVNCPGKVTIQCFRYNPGTVKISMTTQHEHHTHGDDDDIRTIPLAVKHVQRIEQLLILSNIRKVVHDMLKELQDAPACYRR
ncbi:hypothetical protein [Absidia glauca]|uniref:FAR1 domain-containing protein n=1 Tax=Absidia glauca TaxID=4829 RepID=A0A168M2I4_ABSGL|nr:hypothetical protein [Absidia glauca]